MKKAKITKLGPLFGLLIILAFPLPGISGETGRGFGVPIQRLPKNLRGLKVKDHFLPSSFKAVGVIRTLKGHVVVIHRATADAYFGTAGDTIYENDSLNTLANSRCRIKFIDDDVVNMGGATEFSVERFQDQRNQRKKRTFFSMLKGKVRFYAFRLFRYRKRNVRLRTPTAVLGVRGTKFGVYVYRVEEKKSSELGYRVADSGTGIGIYLASADTGGKSYTDCFCEDGSVEVEAGGQTKEVGPGEMYDGETGDVIPTPEGYVDQFQSDTNVEEEGKGKGKEEGPMIPPEEPDQQTISDTIESQTGDTQQETGQKTEEGNPIQPQSSPGPSGPSEYIDSGMY